MTLLRNIKLHNNNNNNRCVDGNTRVERDRNLFVLKQLSFVGCSSKIQEDNKTKKKSLGEQTLALKNGRDRIVALRRTTAAMQVTLARIVVLKALSLLAVRYTFNFILLSSLLLNTT